MIILLSTVCSQVWCSDDQFARTTSDSIIPFLVAGELLLAADHHNGKQKAIQGAKALLTTGVITEALKLTVGEKRPHSDSRTSFTSGHTSTAFAMATVLADYKPEYKIPAYGIAALIGWSRVEVGAHHWHDVAAGMALGYFTAKHFTGEHLSATPDGLMFNWKW